MSLSDYCKKKYRQFISTPTEKPKKDKEHKKTNVDKKRDHSSTISNTYPSNYDSYQPASSTTFCDGGCGDGGGCDGGGCD